MDDYQMPISGYVQIDMITCIGVDFAGSRIVVNERNPFINSVHLENLNDLQSQ